MAVGRLEPSPPTLASGRAGLRGPEPPSRAYNRADGAPWPLRPHPVDEDS